MSTPEEWRPCFGGYYAVSNMGRVRREVAAVNTRVGRILKPYVGKVGYLVVGLKDGTQRKTAYIHRLVAEAFLGPCRDGMQVNHINGDKTDARLANLEYVTASDNLRHAYATGLNRGAAGEMSGRAKVTSADVVEIRALAAEQGLTPRQIGLRFGIGKRTTWAIIARRTWRHVA